MGLPVTTACYFHESPEGQKKGTLIPVLIKVTDFLYSNRETLESVSGHRTGWRLALAHSGHSWDTSCWMEFNHPPAEGQAPFPSRGRFGVVPCSQKARPRCICPEHLLHKFEAYKCCPCPRRKPWHTWELLLFARARGAHPGFGTGAQLASSLTAEM